MATKETVYKEQNKFSKSVGAGIKSVFGSSGRTYYILEHKTLSSNYRAGENQQIIIDYIELGRDPKCQVCFGDSFPTVSGRHAAIVKEGNHWVLKQLSKTNPTIVNGIHRVGVVGYTLENGDEIQLSMEGPKLGFLIPAQNLVKSLGLTNRLNLFREQALRPYKQAITAMSVVFLFAAILVGYFIWNQGQELARQIAKNDEMMRNVQKIQGNADSLRNVVAQNNTTQKEMAKKFKQLQELVRNTPPPVYSPPVDNPPTPSNTVPLDPLFNSVYYVTVDKIVVQFQGQTEEIIDYRWGGTGYLLNDKKFVTARHVIEAWFFLTPEDQAGMMLNMVANNGGSVVAHFTAHSPDGSTLSFKSTDFNFDRTRDEDFQTSDNEGNMVLLKKASLQGGSDWAVHTTNKEGLITTNNNLSNNLTQGMELHILGYPLGIGADSPTNISPLYSTCPVAQSGLHDGIIRITGRSFDHGNSGGPVFVLNSDNKYEAIGIISAGIGTSVGFIVPISVIPR